MVVSVGGRVTCGWGGCAGREAAPADARVPSSPPTLPHPLLASLRALPFLLSFPPVSFRSFLFFLLLSSSPSVSRYFDFEKLAEVTQAATRNLNKIIDVNFYPVETARRSNMRHRPIGLGVQGLADTFLLLGLPFDSEEAAELNRQIFETIYFAALRTSMQLAKTEGARARCACMLWLGGWSCCACFAAAVAWGAAVHAGLGLSSWGAHRRGVTCCCGMLPEEDAASWRRTPRTFCCPLSLNHPLHHLTSSYPHVLLPRPASSPPCPAHWQAPTAHTRAAP